MNELSKNELMEVEGGKVAPWYPETDNPIVYIAGFFYNVVVSVRNFFGDYP